MSDQSKVLVDGTWPFPGKPPRVWKCMVHAATGNVMVYGAMDSALTRDGKAVLVVGYRHQSERNGASFAPFYDTDLPEDIRQWAVEQNLRFAHSLGELRDYLGLSFSEGKKVTLSSDYLPGSNRLIDDPQGHHTHGPSTRERQWTERGWQEA